MRYPNPSVSIEDLALAGFVYEGDGKTVRCAECRVRFMDWTGNAVLFSVYYSACETTAVLAGHHEVI